MKTCVFFGHRDSQSKIATPLYEAIEKWILEEGVTRFYVGNQGNFDALVLLALRQLKRVYPQISYAVVLAYIPKGAMLATAEETVFPEKVAVAPPRFAIEARNRWLLENAEYVIANVCTTHGGAYKFYQMALKKGKTVLNLAPPLSTENDIQ